MGIFAKIPLMKLYQLHSCQNLRISKEEAWKFISDPANLKVITPDHMGFDILGKIDRPMFPGQIIHYQVAPFAGFKTKWVTEITHVQEGAYFVDEQRFGPYTLWHHKHFIRSVEGGVEMEDIIDYKLPLGLLGQLVHGPLVKKQLKTIFSFRAKKLAELFGNIPGSQEKLMFKSI